MIEEVMTDNEIKSTMKEFMTNDHANYYSGIKNITVNGKNAYELKGRFLDDLHYNAFSGTYGEDAVKHIEYFLKFVDPIDLPNVNHNRLRIAIFLISLVGNARGWFDEIRGSTTTWVDLTENFFGKYYPPSRACNIVKTKVKDDLTNIMFEEWLASKFANHIEMDPFIKKVLQNFWKKNDDRRIFLIKDFGLKEANNNDEQENVDPELFTYDVERTKTCEDYVNKFDDEPEEPWNYIRGPYANYYRNFLDMNKQEDEERCELFDDQDLPVCNIKRFEMIKYSSGDDKEYVVVKEDEYNDLTSISEDACRAYQEIFCMMDEGWMVTRAE
ncbi:hypothetical protein Tco_1409198 [Tanacetum coccineum]